MAKEAQQSSRTIKVGKYRIFIREAGSGPMVLLLHGWPETSASWHKQLTPLAEAGYRAVALDGLGYGGSSKPAASQDYRITELVGVAAGVVEALGHKTATVVGNDWGSLVAWTSAWTRPDVFTAVVGMGAPFGGPGLMAMPVSPFGELRPAEVARQIAGPDRMFMTEYFALPGRFEAEFESDVYGFLRDIYFSGSASAYGPDAEQVDASSLTREQRVEYVRNTSFCPEPGHLISEGFVTPEEIPDWLGEDTLALAAAEFERTGIGPALNWYRCMDINWELLRAYEPRPVEVPTLYIAADHDLSWIVSQESIARMGEKVPDLRGQILFETCGHWIQQEQPEKFNRHLLEFLNEL